MQGIQLGKQLLIIIVVSYTAIVAWTYLAQHSLIYFPGEEEFYDCSILPEYTVFESHNNTRMYVVPGTEEAVVMYHGNAGTACERGYLLQDLNRSGATVVLVEYAGYAGDRRRPNKALLQQDVQNVISYLKEHNYTQIYIMGESIGSALAAYHASLSQPENLLLLAPFTSLADVAAHHYPWLPVRLLLRDNYQPVEYLGLYNGSVIIIHGEHDRVVPATFGIQLFDVLPSEHKNLIVLEHIGHDVYASPHTQAALDVFLGLNI